MKNFLALLLALILALSLSACKKADEILSSNGSVPSSLTTETTNIKTPEDYSVVLLASINPQVKLYLDKDGIVLALEAVNDDAKEIIDDIVYDGADYQTVIKLFIYTANTNGFIKDNATIEFEIIESKDTEIDTNDILNNASAAATKASSELEITLDVKVVGNIESENEDKNKTDTSSETESDTNKPDSTPDTDKTNSDSHTHSYSNATCTKAATCSCGATNGKATGHDWKAADCKAPKTCKTCGSTEGEKGDHNYSGGKCTVCGAASALNPKTDLKTYVEYIGNLHVSGDMLMGVALQFEDDACVVTERFFNSVQSDPAQSAIKFEGKNYYSEGGGQNPHYFELTDTEIIIKGSFWEGDPDAVTVKLTLQGDGMLKVTYSTNSLLPVGTILSTNINDVLK